LQIEKEVKITYEYSIFYIRLDGFPDGVEGGLDYDKLEEYHCEIFSADGEKLAEREAISHQPAQRYIDIGERDITVIFNQRWKAEHKGRYKLFRGEEPFFGEGNPCPKETEGR